MDFVGIMLFTQQVFSFKIFEYLKLLWIPETVIISNQISDWCYLSLKSVGYKKSM